MTRTIYLDELSLAAAWRLLWMKDLKRIIVLDTIKTRQKVWRLLLLFKRINISEAFLFAGHLYKGTDEAVYLKAGRIVGQLALDFAKYRVNSDKNILEINQNLGKNTVQLFIAKHLQIYVNYWIIRGLTADSLSENANLKVDLLIKKPYLFEEELLKNQIEGVNYSFYPTRFFGAFGLLKTFAFLIGRDLKMILSHLGKPESETKYNSEKPSVLMLQEDSIRLDKSLRGQPHWINKATIKNFNTYILAFNYRHSAIVKDKKALSKSNVEIISSHIFHKAELLHRKHKTITNIRKTRKNLTFSLFLTKGFPNKYFKLQLLSLLRQAERIGSLSLFLNTKVFLIREVQATFSDALQLVSSEIGVTTVGYQYSNMGRISPLMLSTADELIIFSDMYKKVFKTDDISPGKFISAGYIYQGVGKYVKEKSLIIRKKLNEQGVEFVICYFDESVQHDRWGLVNKENHLEELRILMQAVLCDPTLGIIVKSQFMFNSPSKLFPKDEFIIKAKSTGRYYELMEGTHRNDIYPAETALAADICISHKFGATSGLEAASLGVRCILLDIYGTQTFCDDIYSKGDIVYKNLNFLLKNIDAYRRGDINKKSLGDWTSIIHHFDAYRDGKPEERLRNILDHNLGLIQITN